MAGFKIECSDEMMAKIEEIAFSSTQVEVGGFLVGHYDATGATVTDVLAAQHSVGRQTQLTFTHDTWNALHSDLKESGGQLVGWFHSHPNFGVFLSEHDQFIQQNFFKVDGNITIVVDPIRGRRGWFYSHDGKIKKYEKEEDTTRQRLGKSATNPDENIEAIMGTSNSGMTTAKVVMISAVMSLLGTFLGFALNTATSGSSSASGDIAALNQRIIILEAQQGFTTPVVPTTTPKPKPTVAATKKPAVAPSGKSTTKTGTVAPKGETATATTLNTVNVIPGKTCKPGDVDPAKTYICSPKKGSKPPVNVWVAPTKSTKTPAPTGNKATPTPSTITPATSATPSPDTSEKK